MRKRERMEIHEISIASVYLSPLLLYALFALPITYGVRYMIHRYKLSRFIWHEMLFIVALYVIIFSIITLLSPL